MYISVGKKVLKSLQAGTDFYTAVNELEPCRLLKLAPLPWFTRIIVRGAVQRRNQPLEFSRLGASTVCCWKSSAKTLSRASIDRLAHVRGDPQWPL